MGDAAVLASPATAGIVLGGVLLCCCLASTAGLLICFTSKGDKMRARSSVVQRHQGYAAGRRATLVRQLSEQHTASGKAAGSAQSSAKSGTDSPGLPEELGFKTDRI